MNHRCRLDQLLIGLVNHCNDIIEKIIALKSEPLLRLVQQLGGLPIMGNSSGWIEGLNFDWLNLLIKMRLLGVDFNYFFDFKVAPSLQDNRKPIIYVSGAD